MDKLNWESKFENKLGLTENDYNEILKRINDEENKEKTRIIPIEVQRTLSKDFQEKNPNFPLEEVLKIFVISNGDLGYKSGMSFIGKMILKITNNNKVKTFIILRNIFENKYLKDLYLNNIEYIKHYCDNIFNNKIPLLFQYFKDNNLDLFDNFAFVWIFSLFSMFKNDIGEYIFKLFIEKGDFNIYFYSVITILKMFEKDLLKKNNIEILQFLNDQNIIINMKKFTEILNDIIN